MANAKEIKERMASIEETRKITNAMYLISSSKMKQAKKKLADTEPFFYAMQAEIARILRHVPDMHSQFFDGRESIPAEERKIGYIVVTADKGLAGHVVQTGETINIKDSDKNQDQPECCRSDPVPFGIHPASVISIDVIILVLSDILCRIHQNLHDHDQSHIADF